MTSIQLFYSRDCPGDILRANTLQALDHLGINAEMRTAETVPEQIGAPLPALAIDGKIVVSGVEPSVREL
ncbi:thioredoxin family protein [uncultured Akkermansia sp.]|nr:thioredoxin family protein [uncultured Akkermansia sp.]